MATTAPHRYQLPGAERIAARLELCAQGFQRSVQERGFTAAAAARIFERYRVLGVIKIDFPNLTWRVTHGAYWEPEVLRKALGEVPA